MAEGNFNNVNLVIRFYLLIVHLFLLDISTTASYGNSKKPCELLFQAIANARPFYFELLPTPEISENWHEIGDTVLERVNEAVIKHAKQKGVELDDIFGSATPHWGGHIARELFENSAQWAHNHDPTKHIRIEIFDHSDGIIVMVTDSGSTRFDPQSAKGKLSQFADEADWVAFRKKAGTLGYGKHINFGMFWDGMLDPHFPCEYYLDRSRGMNRVLISVPWKINSDGEKIQ